MNYLQKYNISRHFLKTLLHYRMKHFKQHTAFYLLIALSSSAFFAPVYGQSGHFEQLL